MPLFRTPEGTVVDIDDSKVNAAISQGFEPVTAHEHVAEANAKALHPTSGGVLGTANAALTGALSGLTLGGSDVALRSFMTKDQADRMANDRADHPIASTAGTVAGAILPSIATGGAAAPEEGALLGTELAAVTPAARAVSLGAKARAALETAGTGSLAAHIGGGAVEGAAFGAGQGVSELALSNDPLTAEHVASVLSSNVLLGGVTGGVAGAGTKLVERGLQIAGDKLAAVRSTRTAVDGLPADLQGLDEAGLKDALAKAKTDHAADIAAERKSLEELRVNQRAELANQVKDLHEELATERPIFQALSEDGELTAKLKGIEGVPDARVQLAKSFDRLRSALDSPLSVQRDPFPLIRPLEQRQAALEALQQKLPEMHAALAGDARAAMLEHVDGALAETKQQIAAIRNLREAPLASGRLTALEAGPSARMQAIDAARDALKNAPELGMVGKGASSAAFGGVTALAHMIPGVGLAAPFMGKAAANAVEKLFQRGAGALATATEQASSAAGKFLGAAKALGPYAAPTATAVMSAVRFGPSGSTDATEPATADLGTLFRHRTSELYAQTMRQPDGTTVMRPEARKELAAKLDPIRHVNPILADKLEDIQARKATYLASIAPKRAEAPAMQIGPDEWKPPDMEIRRWARAIRAVEVPTSVEERLARGVITPEEAQAYRAVYPERFAALQREIFEAAPQLDKTLPMAKKVALSVFTGIPVTPAMQPNVLAVLQATFEVEPGSEGGTQAPRPEANFGAFGSLKDIDKPTPAQKHEGA